MNNVKGFKKQKGNYRITGVTEDGKSYMLRIYQGGSLLNSKRIYIADLESHESIESKALEMIELAELEEDLSSWGRCE